MHIFIEDPILITQLLHCRTKVITSVYIDQCIQQHFKLALFKENTSMLLPWLSWKWRSILGITCTYCVIKAAKHETNHKLSWQGDQSELILIVNVLCFLNTTEASDKSIFVE